MNIPAGFTPVGTVISVMGNSAPQNYLACNGQVVNIASYPELANYFEAQFGSKNKFGGDGTNTFAVPDLRGEFLRGTGTNGHAYEGSGAAVGTHQNATRHIALLSDVNATYICSPTNFSAGQFNEDYVDNTGATNGRYSRELTIKSTTKQENIASNSPYTSRPTNTSVLYCIATKNIYVDARYDYSTEEKVVGTWIDGKPLYQKTVEIDLSSTTAPSTDRTSIVLYDTTSLSPDEVFVEDDMSTVGSDSTTIAQLNHINTAGSYACPCVNSSDKKVYYIIEGQNYYYQACGKTGGKVVLTIRYTKTTD